MHCSEVRIPFGQKHLSFQIPQEKLLGVFTPRCVAALDDVDAAVRQALENPVEAAPLKSILQKGSRIVIVVDDVSRPIPTANLLKPLLDEIQAQGVGLNAVTVLVATGVHRPATAAEMKIILGEFYGRIRILNHDADDPEQLVRVGTTALGTEVSINRTFIESDIRIVVADVEYHQFCGYGGGAKSIFPGIANRAAIASNHSRLGLAGADIGCWKSNPLRQEIEEVGRMAGVDFLLSVVLNYEKQIVKVVGGDLQAAFLTCMQTVDAMYAHQIQETADLVISSPGGYPKDIDLYQSQKALSRASAIVKEKGNIIVMAECPDGHGSDLFYDWVRAAQNLDDIIAAHNQKFVLGGHKAFLYARDLSKAQVHLFSSLRDDFVREFFMHPVSLEEIEQQIATSQKIAVLPYASSTNIVIA